MFPETHKIIAKKIHEEILIKYNINLDRKRLIWGAISPDILPKYKIYRHYKKDSENMIINEIISLIYIIKSFDLHKLSRFRRNMISIKLGVISHFLCDYVTLPHKDNWTFYDNCIKHLKYEKTLNQLAKNHKFKNIIENNHMNIYDNNVVLLKTIIKKYLDSILIEYSKKEEYSRDLDFGFGLSLTISSFILELADEVSLNSDMKYSFVF